MNVKSGYQTHYKRYSSFCWWKILLFRSLRRINSETYPVVNHGVTVRRTTFKQARFYGCLESFLPKIVTGSTFIASQISKRWKKNSSKRRSYTLRKLSFYFLSNWMGYDRGDSFPFDFQPNGIPFGSENRKENCHHDHIPFNLKGNGTIVFSVRI